MKERRISAARRWWAAKGGSPHGPRRCGHRRKNPILVLPGPPAGWPMRGKHTIQLRAIDRARAIYFDRWFRFHRLLNRAGGRYVTRKQSARTEAQCRVLAFFLDRWDLASGYVRKEDGRSYSVHEITIATGLSPWQVERAISDLVHAGYIERHQKRRESDTPARKGKPEGVVATTKICEALFLDLRMTRKEVDRYRNQAREKRGMPALNPNRSGPPAPLARVLGTMKQAAAPWWGAMYPERPKPSAPPPRPRPPRPIPPDAPAPSSGPPEPWPPRGRPPD